MILAQMSKDLGLPLAFVKRVVQRAPHSYKSYRIPKRSGGTRTIDHPSAELKVLQRWVVGHVVSMLPVHPSVYSYRKGLGIRAHADAHRRNNFLLRIDLKNFFPSITADDVAMLLRSSAEHFDEPLTEEDIAYICRITCKRHVVEGRPVSMALTIGSPSSPPLSNAMLFRLDTALRDLCATKQVSYTRYADDLYFSTNAPGVLSPLLGDVRAIIRQSSTPRLVINDDKTVFTSRKRRRTVTGVVLTSTGGLSVGRAKKRYLRSLVFKFASGSLAPEEIARLRGLLSQATDIDRDFEASLIRKFGEAPLLRLKVGGDVDSA